MAENACSHRYNMDKGKSGEMAFSAKLGYSPTIPIPCQKMASDTSLHKFNLTVESTDISINLSCSIAMKSSSSALSANWKGDTIQSRFKKETGNTYQLFLSAVPNYSALIYESFKPAACWRRESLSHNFFWTADFYKISFGEVFHLVSLCQDDQWIMKYISK